MTTTHPMRPGLLLAVALLAASAMTVAPWWLAVPAAALSWNRRQPMGRIGLLVWTVAVVGLAFLWPPDLLPSLGTVLFGSILLWAWRAPSAWSPPRAAWLALTLLVAWSPPTVMLLGWTASVLALLVIERTAWPEEGLRRAWRARRSGLLLACAAALLTAVIVPRLRWPIHPDRVDLATLMTPTAGGWSGFGDTTPIAKVTYRMHAQPDATYAMRLPATAVPLAWRVAKLEHFDGRTWSLLPPLPPAPRPPPHPLAPAPPPVPVPVWMQATWRALVATDTPAAPDVPGAGLTPSASPLGRQQVTQAGLPWPPAFVGIQTGWRLGGITPAQRHRDLQLPPGAAPRTRAWAAALRRRWPHDDAAIVAAMLKRFAHGYTYSTDPPLPPGDPTDGFVWVTKTGYCQHYASALAVMLRAAGIPARVAVGYAVTSMRAEVVAPDRQPTAHPRHAVASPARAREGASPWTSLIRVNDAHAWVEAYSTQWGGWERIDPTALAHPRPPSAIRHWWTQLWNHLPAWARNNPWTAGVLWPHATDTTRHHAHRATAASPPRPVLWVALLLAIVLLIVARRPTPTRAWTRLCARLPLTPIDTPRARLEAARAAGLADAELTDLIEAWSAHRYGNRSLPPDWIRRAMRWRPTVPSG